MAKSKSNTPEVKKADKTDVTRDQIHGWFVKGYKASRATIIKTVSAIAASFETATAGLPEEVKAFAFAARSAVSLKTLATYAKEVGLLDEKDKAPQTMSGLITLMFKADGVRNRSIAQSLAFAASDYAKAHNLKAPTLTSRVKRGRTLKVGIRGMDGKAGYTQVEPTNPEALGAVVKWLGGEVGVNLTITETGAINTTAKNLSDPAVVNILWDRYDGMNGLNILAREFGKIADRKKEGVLKTPRVVTAGAK